VRRDYPQITELAAAVFFVPLHGEGPASLASLSPQELARYAAFGDAAAAARFANMRVALRQVLGHYLHMPPQSVPLANEAGGKLALVSPAAVSTVQFSVSHADSLGLIAACRGRAIGVDVEHQRNCNGLAIARRMFGQLERARVEAATEQERSGVFFDLWVAYEAVAKVRGVGLTAMAHRGLEESGCTVRTLDAPREYHAAVALESMREVEVFAASL
jgi:4'-phosphopantetheinyl transferase